MKKDKEACNKTKKDIKGELVFWSPIFSKFVAYGLSLSTRINADASRHSLNIIRPFLSILRPLAIPLFPRFASPLCLPLWGFFTPLSLLTPLTPHTPLTPLTPLTLLTSLNPSPHTSPTTSLG